MRRNIYKIIITILIFSRCSNGSSGGSDKENSKKGIDTVNYINFTYNKVVAFASVEPSGPHDSLLNKKIDLSKFMDTISRILDNSQVTRLAEILNGKLNENTFSEPADCFNPRHHIAFLNDNDSVVNYISVCFDCSRIKSSKTQNGGINNFMDFFNSIGIKVFEMPDRHRQYYDSLTKLKHNK